MKTAIILRDEPVIAVIASQKIRWEGVEEMTRWVNDRRPECVPQEALRGDPAALFPHDLYRGDGMGPNQRDLPTAEVKNALTDNELLVELAGRKCYDSFGAKAGRKSNAEYIANTQQGDVPHASILYHAKMTFFFAGVSRRVSHELIRNYVGADRDEEGAPSQESTRYVEHAGRYIQHPFTLDDADESFRFNNAMAINYNGYLSYIDRMCVAFEKREGRKPTQMDRKRIYESASTFLSHACETSWLWTTNPGALAKMIRERANPGADLEFFRFAKKLARICVAEWPNLFPQPWVREAASL